MKSSAVKFLLVAIALVSIFGCFSKKTKTLSVPVPVCNPNIQKCD